MSFSQLPPRLTFALIASRALTCSYFLSLSLYLLSLSPAQCFVSKAVLAEVERIIEDSEVRKRARWKHHLPWKGCWLLAACSLAISLDAQFNSFASLADHKGG